MEEPRLTPASDSVREYDDQRSLVRYSRNAKGDTQLEVKVYEGSTREQMTELQQIAFDTYKAGVEAAGMLVTLEAT